MRVRDVWAPKIPPRAFRAQRTDEALDQASRLAGEIRLPTAGQCSVKATSAVAASVDLGAAGSPPAENAAFGANIPKGGSQSVANSTSGGGTVQAITVNNPEGFIGKWIDIYADAQDIGIIAGPTQASVTSGNAPVLANNDGSAGTCFRIAAGTYRSYYVDPDRRWLGYVGAGNGQMRIAPSSR